MSPEFAAPQNASEEQNSSHASAAAPALPQTDLLERPSSHHNGSTQPASPTTSVRDIAEQLNSRIEDVARELLGAPNEELSSKNQLRYGRNGSLAIEIAGAKAGCWYDHESETGGNGLELVRHQERVSHSEAIHWARRFLGLHATRRSSKQLTASQQALEHAHNNQVPAVESAHAEKVAAILATVEPISNTPGEHYLRSRGITATLPGCIGFRRRAFDPYGAVVALATNSDGEVLAVQQIYVTAVGGKASLAVRKRTNKAVDGWAHNSAVRLPGKAPLILAEGVETALSIWQATGHETWACLGISNIGHAPVPDGAAVIVARDGDEAGSKADRQIQKVMAALQARGHSVSVASPPPGEDFNDVMVKGGPNAICALIDDARPFTPIAAPDTGLNIGSDVEMARRVRDDLTASFGRVVHTEGRSWRYCGTHWAPIPDNELRRAVHVYDGAYFQTFGGRGQVKLGKARIDSVLNEFATLCAAPTFFESPLTGINCASGFILFASDGSATVEPHRTDHRCRHTLPGRWKTGREPNPPEGSLLHQLLDGVFQGDADAAEKITLLSEVCGSAALGFATQLIQPRAVILFGQTAENGKSQILDLARGLLPPNAVCSLPAARMGDERHIVGLVGKLLNATDELSAAAIASDTFKSVVTGEPVQGRDVYKSRAEFRPVAQNLFATNNLPPFLGGMDRGVQRRLLVVPFNRTIPIENRIEFIGRRIAKDEPDLLLAWAVEGASRLVRQRNFSIPRSCKHALDEWLFAADPVLAWMSECVEVRPILDHQPAIATRKAYNNFQNWAVTEGFKNDKLPAINGFVQRVLANTVGVEKRRTGYGRQFEGLVLKGASDVPF